MQEKAPHILAGTNSGVRGAWSQPTFRKRSDPPCGVPPTLRARADEVSE
jgi:hypothetical protein